MRKKKNSKAFAGIDLHGTNSYIGIVDENNERLYGKRHKNELTEISAIFKPFKKELIGIAVESTYNWYWLVDGLSEDGYTLHLANPAAIQQYNGLKHTDDKSDAFWLANMLRLNILPEGYIYSKEDRPVRDLFRRRIMFVKHRTAQILSLKSTIARNLGIEISSSKIKKMDEVFAEELFDSSILVFTAKQNISSIQNLNRIIKEIELEAKSMVKLKKEFQLLLTTPGIGDILALTIMLEVGDIRRFITPGQYSSYCRCVESIRTTNMKKKGKNNSKNGNRYLAWAYIEAANFARRYNVLADKFYQKKAAQRNRVLATKALANKLSKATYFIMRDQVPFKPEMIFRK